MNTETRVALDKSIEKWKQNLVHAIAYSHMQITTSPNDCPLCSLFFYGGNDCEGCPIYKKTGLKGCQGTPYRCVMDTISEIQLDLVINKTLPPPQKWERLIASVTDEVQFLMGIRDEETLSEDEEEL